MSKAYNQRVIGAAVAVSLLMTICVGTLAGPAAAAGEPFSATEVADILIEPSTGRVFVSAYDKVVVFSPNGDLIGEVPGLWEVAGLNAQDGVVFVVERASSEITEIDAATLAIVHSYTLPEPPGPSVAVLGDTIWYSVDRAVGFDPLFSLDRTTGVSTERGGSFARAGLYEVPGRSDRLLAATSGRVHLVDISKPMAESIGSASSSDPYTPGVAVAPDGLTFWATSGSLLEEYSIPSMDETGRNLAAGPALDGVAFSPVSGGVVAGSAGSEVVVHELGYGAEYRLPAGSVAPGAVEIVADGSAVYAVTTGPTPGTFVLSVLPIAPSLTSTTPASVIADVPTDVIMAGNGLVDIEQASVDGTPVPYEVLSGSSVQVEVPSGLDVGEVTLELTSTRHGQLSISIPVLENTGATLHGFVQNMSGVDLEDGIEVTLSGGALAGPLTVVTDSEGAYAFPPVGYGNYRVAVHDPSGVRVDQVFTGLHLRPNLDEVQDFVLPNASTPPVEFPVVAETDLLATPRDVIVDTAHDRIFAATGDSVSVLDTNARLLGQIVRQPGADQLVAVGDDLYINLATARQISHIDLDTLDVVDVWPTDRATTGDLAFAGGRLWYAGNAVSRGMVALDPATGKSVEVEMGAANGGSELASVDGAPDSLLVAGSSRIDQFTVAGDVAVPVASVAGPVLKTPREIIASADAGKVWTASGQELALGTLVPTGNVYPAGGGTVAHTPELGGALALGDRISLVGQPTRTTQTDIAAVDGALAFSDDGRRVISGASGSSLVVWDLTPRITGSSLEGLAPDEASTVTLTGDNLGLIEDARAGGESVPFSVDGAEVTVDIPGKLVPATSEAVNLEVASAFGVSPPFDLPVGELPPGAPQNVLIAGLEEGVWVTWEAPAYIGSAPVSSYIVKIDDQEVTVGADVLEHTFTGFPPGVRVKASVTAVSPHGTGPPVFSALTWTYREAPSVPTGITNVAGPGTLTVSWAAPLDSGTAPITAYEVLPSGSSEYYVVGPGVRSILFYSVPSDLAFSFEVRARSDHGVSEWEASPTVSPLDWVPLFIDVPLGHPFYAEIWWGVANGITDGYPDGNFRPTAQVTRQAVVTWLWRLAGSPRWPVYEPPFSDVPVTHPFAEAITWATKEGIVNGFSDGTFRPGQPVSRMAVLAFLWRIAGSPTGPFDDPGFSDVPPGSPFQAAIRWAVEHGIATGFPDGTFRPAADVTRQAGIAFFSRAY